MQLLIDGVTYTSWTPPNEEALENMVYEHANDIFGDYSIYFSVKKRLTSQAGIVTIPDGYVIEFGNIPCWYIVEVELSSHSLFDHIFPQVSKFRNAINDLNNQRVIVNTLYREIQGDAIMKARVSSMIGSREIHEFLYSLVARRPILVIVIEQKAKELDDVCTSLSLQSKVVEFKTFATEGIGLPDHAHLFEPLNKPIMGKQLEPLYAIRIERNDDAARDVVPETQPAEAMRILSRGSVHYAHYTKIAAEMGVAPKNANTVLDRLVKAGKVTRLGKGMYGLR